MREKSPWVSVWVEPRATIRKIVAENPSRSLWLLAAIYGFPSLLNTFQSLALGNYMQALPLFFLALILSPLWGRIIFSVWSWVVYGIGKIFKGKADFQKVRAAYAWSCVPIAINGVLWIFLMFLFGTALFTYFPQEHFLSNSQALVLFVILIGKVVLAIWSLVIYLNALSEVQGFSVLRAIGNVMLAGVVVGVGLGVIWMLSLEALGIALEQSSTAFQLFHDGKMLETVRMIRGGV